MPSKKIALLICLVTCFFQMFGCSGMQNPPLVKNYYSLDSQKPAPMANPLIDQGRVLLIRELFIAPEFDSHAFIYKIDEHEYTSDFYNEFVSYPARLITSKIAHTLYSSKYFTPFLASSKQNASFRLSGKITHLYADIRPDKPPETFLQILFILEKKDDDSFKKVFTSAYLDRRPLSSSKPGNLAESWSKSLNTIASDLLKDIENKGDTIFK